MSTNIGTLAAIITADSAPFVKSTSQVKKIAQETHAVLKSTIAAPIAIGAGIMGALGIGSISSEFKQGFDDILAVGKEAHRVGSDVKEFAGIAAMAGSDVGQFGAAIGRLSRELGAAQTGSEQAQSLFRSLGLSASELAGMPLPARLGRIADQMNAIQDPTARAYAEFQLFGKGFQEIIPLLEKGSVGIAKAGQKAQDFHLAFSEQDLASVRAANRALKDIDLVLAGIRRQLALAGAPLLESLAKIATDLLKKVDLKEVFVKGFEFATKAAVALLRVLADVARTVDRFSGRERTPQEEALHQFESEWKFGPDTEADKAQHAFLKSQIKTPGSEIAQMADLIDKGADDLLKSLREKAPPKTPPGIGEVDPKTLAMIEHVNQLTKGLRDQAAAMKLAHSAGIDLAAATDLMKAKEMNANDEMLKSVQAAHDMVTAQKLIGEAVSPLEKFGSDLMQLNRLLDDGAIGFDVYAEAAAKAFQGVAKMSDKATTLPTFATAGSREAFDVLTRSESGATDPTTRVTDRLDQLKAVAQQQRDYEREIAAQLRRIKPADLKK